MGRKTKWALALLIINSVAAAFFLTGAVNVSATPGYYLTFSLAALFYGMFLILGIFEKDAAEFDAEHSAHHEAPDIQPHNFKALHDPEHHDSMAA